MEIKKVGKDEFFRMIEKLKDFSRELDIWRPVAHQLNIDIEEIRISTKSLLQIMEAIDKQLKSDPTNESIQEQCGPFYEMSQEICSKIKELHSHIEDKSEIH
jgi:energy-converting hydrogenase A subunit M